jgi:uncharacterized membrane protein
LANGGMFADRNKLHGMVLGVLGIIALIAGIAVATIHSSLRGSGLGTALAILGVILLIIAVWRFTKKVPK